MASSVADLYKTILPALRLGASSGHAFSATGPVAVKLRLCAKRPKPQLSEERGLTQARVSWLASEGLR
jgi:hypothetical protein